LKKILIPMIEAGGGHVMPALAIKDAIEELYPGKYKVDVIDFAKECGAYWDDKIIKGFWDWALERPELITNLNKLLDSMSYFTRSNTIMRFMYRQFVRKGMRYIAEYKPDIIFSTHFFCTSVAVFAKERYNSRYKIFSYMTDPVRGHNMWVNPRVNAVVAATKEASEYLIKQGQPKSRLKIMPFPLNKKFFIKIDKSKNQILSELGLNLSLKTILATSGGQGIGETANYINMLYEAQMPFNIIAVCGKNKELYNKLTELKTHKKSNTSMVVLGFVNNMHELLEAADLAIAKGGASTTFELLVKNVPAIFTHSAALHEQGNIDFCVKNKMGWFVRNKKEFMSVIDSILSSDILKNYNDNIKANEYIKTLPGAADNIARFIADELESQPKKYVDRKSIYFRTRSLRKRMNI
jgi:1,2-diacylglycerol 3-beta-galactosyltransferase